MPCKRQCQENESQETGENFCKDIADKELLSKTYNFKNSTITATIRKWATWLNNEPKALTDTWPNKIYGWWPYEKMLHII